MSNEEINIKIAKILKYDGEDIPNYCEDLNLMHKAEHKIPSELIMNYAYHLNYSVWNYHSYMASAKQRAIAFLKVFCSFGNESHVG